jgi:hypothetical protein
MRNKIINHPGTNITVAPLEKGIGSNQIVLSGLRMLMSKETYMIYNRAIKRYTKTKNMVNRLKNRNK